MWHDLRSPRHLHQYGALVFYRVVLGQQVVHAVVPSAQVQGQARGRGQGQAHGHGQLVQGSLQSISQATRCVWVIDGQRPWLPPQLSVK